MLGHEIKARKKQEFSISRFEIKFCLEDKRKSLDNLILLRIQVLIKQLLCWHLWDIWIIKNGSDLTRRWQPRFANLLLFKRHPYPIVRRYLALYCEVWCDLFIQFVDHRFFDFFSLLIGHPVLFHYWWSAYQVHCKIVPNLHNLSILILWRYRSNFLTFHDILDCISQIYLSFFQNFPKFTVQYIQISSIVCCQCL